MVVGIHDLGKEFDLDGLLTEDGDVFGRGSV